MKYDVTLERIANSYYNLGLERARLRDLSGAAELLKKSLKYDKYQKDARNLLGLIFFECGEVADALVQWVISMNLLPENNDADYYLDEIQRKPAILRICSENVRRYNQALDYAQNNNEDLAILQLNKVIEENPNFIKAHILLALLYMNREDWVKAGRSLFKVLKIDRNNPKALVLMDEVKQRTGKAEIEQKKLKNVFSHRRMQDDDVVIPQEVRQLSSWQIVGYLLLGIVLGITSFYLLVLPAHSRALNSANNQEIIQYTEKLDAANRENAALESENDTLEAENSNLQAQLAGYESGDASFIQQYQTLNQIIQAYSSGDVMTAATLYVELDQSAVTEPTMVELLNQVRSYMESTGYQTLTNLGTDSWNAGNKTQAITYYTKSLELRQDPETMYLLGRLYQSENNTTEANALFDRIVGEHPDSPYAQRAQEARGY